jgi:hypothetical protein
LSSLTLQVVRPIEELADRLEFTQNSMPDGWLEIVRYVRWKGGYFAKSIEREPLEDVFEIERDNRDIALKNERELTEAVAEYFRATEEPMRSVVLAMFTFGMLDKIGRENKDKKRRPRAIDIASIMQGALTRAFLNMSYPERCEFHRAIPNWSKTDPTAWERSFAGAAASARLAYAFLQDDRNVVYMPAAYYDIHCSGDLVVTSGDDIFYLQIKGCGGIRHSNLKVVVKPEGKVQHRLTKGAQQFAMAIGRQVTPVIAEIGLVKQAPFDLETCDLVRRAAEELLGKREPKVMAR